MAPSVEPLSLYRPRDPRASGLWQVIDRHFPSFQQLYEERFAAKYGFWRPVIERSVAAFLRCGDLARGLRPRPLPRLPARDVRGLFLQAALRLPVVPSEAGAAHRPARGRRGLSSRRPSASGVHHPQAAAAARPLRPQAAGQAGRVCMAMPAGRSPPPAGARGRPAGHDRRHPDPRRTFALAPAHPRPGHLRWRSPRGGREFLEVPQLDKERLRAAWREEVFSLYLAEGKIDAAVVENMRGWPHSGFGAHPSLPLAADDRAGIERLTQYITRCPLSLSRLVRVTRGLSRFCVRRKWDCPPRRGRKRDLPGGEGRLPGVSRSPRRGSGGRDEAEFSGPFGSWSSWRSSRSTFRPRART